MLINAVVLVYRSEKYNFCGFSINLFEIIPVWIHTTLVLTPKLNILLICPSCLKAIITEILIPFLHLLVKALQVFVNCFFTFSYPLVYLVAFNVVFVILSFKLLRVKDSWDRLILSNLTCRWFCTILKSLLIICFLISLTLLSFSFFIVTTVNFNRTILRN